MLSLSIRQSAISLAVFAAITLGSLSTAAANPITISTGNPGNAGTDNVLFNDSNLIHSGLLVQGNFNGSGAGFIIDFTSTSGSGLLQVSGGQATIIGGTGNSPLTNVTFALEGGATFTTAIFNLDVTNGLPSPTTVEFTVNYTLAGGQTVVETFSVNPNGQNFFNIQASMGAVINSITIQGTGNTTFADVNQVRIGGFANPVPEPATMIMLGTGLMGLAAGIRRRRQRR